MIQTQACPGSAALQSFPRARRRVLLLGVATAITIDELQPSDPTERGRKKCPEGGDCSACKRAGASQSSNHSFSLELILLSLGMRGEGHVLSLSGMS
jgi:hypothetical protein